MVRALWLVALAGCSLPAADAATAFQPASFTVSVQGSGRPVILIPGIGCPASVWDGTIAHFAGKLETHTIQLAGFAGAPPMKGDAPLVATARAELAKYIADRHLDHPIVIGHSLGGMVALGLAEDAPELVGPTIIVDQRPVIDADTPLPRKQAVMRPKRAELASASQVDFAIAVRDMFAYMANDPKQLAPIVAAVEKSDHKAFAGALYEIFTDDLRPQLAAIRAPVLFVLAADTPKALVAEEAAKIPSHEVRAIPRTHHFVMLDAPAAFYAAVDAFVAAHP